MELYKRIKARREELSMSQEELAEKMGYKSRSSINKIELGKSDIPQSKIVAFAKALQTSPQYLMGWVEDEEELINYFDNTLEKIITFIETNGFKISDGEHDELLVHDKNNKLIGVIPSGDLVATYEKINCEGAPLTINALLKAFTQEQLLLTQYRTLDDKGKHTVDTVLQMEYNRCNPSAEEKEEIRLAAAHNDNTSPEQLKLMKKDLDEL